MIQDAILRDIPRILPEVIKIRRHIHMHPELSCEETATTAYICKILENNKISYTVLPNNSGIVAELGTGDSAVGIRAELDALRQTDAIDKITFGSKDLINVIGTESEVEEIEITGVGFDANGNVKITVEGKLNTAEGNMNGLGFIPLTGESEKTIECQVLYKKTLDQADWDEVSFPVQITVGSEPQTVTLKIVEDLKSSSSGFFKVKVTE